MTLSFFESVTEWHGMWRAAEKSRNRDPTLCTIIDEPSGTAQIFHKATV